MAKPSAITLPIGSTVEVMLTAAYEDVAEKFASPKGWMGVRTINLVDENEKVAETYLVKFRSKSAELFKATGDRLELPNVVKPKFKAAKK